MIYLIHFARGIGGAKHYLGCCRDDNLADRLRRHARGHGARLTGAAVARSIPMYLVRTFPGGTFEQERMMKERGRFKDLCPMCCEVLRPADPSPYLIDTTRPEQPPARPVWGWTT